MSNASLQLSDSFTATVFTSISEIEASIDDKSSLSLSLSPRDRPIKPRQTWTAPKTTTYGGPIIMRNPQPFSHSNTFLHLIVSAEPTFTTVSQHQHRESRDQPLFLLQLTCRHLSLPKQWQIWEDRKGLNRFSVWFLFYFIFVGNIDSHRRYVREKERGSYPICSATLDPGLWIVTSTASGFIGAVSSQHCWRMIQKLRFVFLQCVNPASIFDKDCIVVKVGVSRLVQKGVWCMVSFFFQCVWIIA